MNLRDQLNGMFRARRSAKRKPGRYVATRGAVRVPVERDRDRLWSATVDGSTYRNSILGDLKSQLADMGFAVSAAPK